MAQLFEFTDIKSLTLRNRFIRSATWEGMADDCGACTPQLTDFFCTLARGEVGLIITGHAYVNKAGQARPLQLGAHNDSLLPGLEKMVQSVHDDGGKIALQLSHSGCYAATEITGLDVYAPSSGENETGQIIREMTHEQIRQVVADFSESAARAQKAGFDAVQIHAAHGYLLSQFLSPTHNRRKDEYGGDLENRARILLEVVTSVRQAVGAEYPILIKINSEDFEEGGFTKEEMIQVAISLEKAGVDAMELSGGTRNSGRNIPFRLGRLDNEEDEVYYREAAKLYKEKISVPLLLVGGFRSYSVAEMLVTERLTDYVSLSRPLVREPDLVRRWQSGDTRKATCISCNLCYKPALEGKGIRCVVEEALKSKKNLNPAARKDDV